MNHFQGRQEGPRHFQHEEILRFVQQALDDINWTTSLLQRKTRLLDLTEFPTVSTDVLVALARNSSFMPIKPFWREGMFLIVLLKVGPSLSLRLLILLTLGGLFDHLTRFVH